MKCIKLYEPWLGSTCVNSNTRTSESNCSCLENMLIFMATMSQINKQKMRQEYNNNKTEYLLVITDSINHMLYTQNIFKRTKNFWTWQKWSRWSQRKGFFFYLHLCTKKKVFPLCRCILDFFQTSKYLSKSSKTHSKK